MRNISQTVLDGQFVSTEGQYKSYIGFPKKVKYLTFGDSERSRSLTEILDAE